MSHLKMPEEIYISRQDVTLFNQLAVKVEMDTVSNDDYYRWLDDTKNIIGSVIIGAEIAEKKNARGEPPLNIAIYYDTPDYRLLPTGALLRTSCNIVTHAFCAFKGAQDNDSVRADYRYVFAGEEKRIIQTAPDSEDAVAIVRRLLSRSDIQHPGMYLKQYCGINPSILEPSIRLDDLRYTFFVWLDKKDALRCSIDRAHVVDLRIKEQRRQRMPVSEVEIAIYPHIDPKVARDSRVVQVIQFLTDSLCREFGVTVTKDIKYQRAARVLSIMHPVLR
jgi:hypothetical protein